MGQFYSKLQAQNTEVLVIGGGRVGNAQVLAKTSRLPYPVLADADRSVYEQYHLGKKLIMMQQSGVVLVDKTGKIQHYQRYTNPTTWMGNAKIDELLKAIEQIG